MKISIIILTLNEEKNITRCLKSVSWADEKIVVDCGSTDKTTSLAKDYDAKVFHHDWQGDGKQKCYGITQAKNDWIIILDADEEVTPELQHAIKKLDITSHNCYQMKRSSFFRNQLIHHGDWGRDYVTRLFNKQQFSWTTNTVHSRLNTPAKPATLKGILLHHTHDNLHQSIEKTNNYSSESAKLLSKKLPLTLAILKSKWAFFRSYWIRRGFLDGKAGYLIAKQISIGTFLKYAKIDDY